jgi:hypothetical protein
MLYFQYDTHKDKKGYSNNKKIRHSFYIIGGNIINVVNIDIKESYHDVRKFKGLLQEHFLKA